MANNCLVTKLKASVNNPDLPIFDALKIHLLPNETPACTIKVDINTYLISPSGSKMAISANTDFANLFIQSSDDVVYQILNGSNISSLAIGGYNNAFYANTKDLKGFNFNILTLRGPSYLSNIHGLVGKLIDIGSFCVDNLHDKSYDFTNCVRLTATDQEFSDFFSRNKNVIMLTNENSGVTLDWDILGTVTNGKLSSTQGAAKGDIYTFIQCARANGRTDGVCEDNYLSQGTNVESLNGTPLPTATFCKIYWTASTVTIKASDTYGGSDIID